MKFWKLITTNNQATVTLAADGQSDNVFNTADSYDLETYEEIKLIDGSFQNTGNKRIDVKGKDSNGNITGCYTCCGITWAEKVV